jgi:long-subunit acyl-CoA synthetase (AMP-forming)
MHACSAEKLEGVFTRSAYISQMFVYGDSYKSYLVGVVVLDLEALGTPLTSATKELSSRRAKQLTPSSSSLFFVGAVPWAKQNLKTNDYSGAALCANPEVQQFIMQEITTQARNAKASATFARPPPSTHLVGPNCCCGPVVCVCVCVDSCAASSW